MIFLGKKGIKILGVCQHQLGFLILVGVIIAGFDMHICMLEYFDPDFFIIEIVG